MDNKVSTPYIIANKPIKYGFMSVVFRTCKIQ